MSSNTSSNSYPPQLKYVRITVSSEKEGFVIFTLNRPPVNSMNTPLWSELLLALDATEKQQRNVRGVIFASGLERGSHFPALNLRPDIFTAGNDLNELYSKGTTKERFIQFWTAQTTLLTRVLSSRLATIAAIRGACPAGGCLLAMACDYRLMTTDTPDAKIGMNEIALGVSLPKYMIQLYQDRLGKSQAEAALLTGAMFTPEEALKHGLINGLATKANLLDQSIVAVKLFTRNGEAGRIRTKQMIRGKLAKEWQDYLPIEIEETWDVLCTPEASESLGKVLAGLHQRKAKL